MPKYTTLTSARNFTKVQTAEQSNASLQEWIDMATADIDNMTARTWQRPQTTGYVYLDGDDTTLLWLPNTDIQKVLALYIDDDLDGTYTRVHAQTNVSGPMSAATQVISAMATAEFPTTGTIYIAGETITYSGTTTGAFLSCTRGGGTGAAAHADKADLYWESNNYIKVYEEGYITLLDDAALNVFTAEPQAVKIKYVHGGVHSTNVSGNVVNTTGTTITTRDTADFPDTGEIIIDDEWMSYTSKGDSIFEGVTRGILGTTAAVHSSGAAVYEAAPINVRLLCNMVVSDYMHEESAEKTKIDDLKNKLKWGGPVGLS